VVCTKFVVVSAWRTCRGPAEAGHHESSANRERGVAVVIALLMTLLVGAIAAALVALTTTETLISASYRHAQEASYGAEAALERGLHDLATMADWSPALAEPPGNVTSGFVDGEVTPRAPDGRTLDLIRLTADRQRESDERDGPAVFGPDSPRWRLFAHASVRSLLAVPEASPGLNLPLYLVVWVADDESDGDGDATVDSNGRILVCAVAFGASGTRRSVGARVARTDAGELRVLAWRSGRD
jgi:hypothetical protein